MRKVKKMKDWTGNKKSTFATLGASNHSNHERETDDFYATDPQSLEIFLNAYLKRDKNTLDKRIWECAVGDGALAKILEQQGYDVKCSDIANRGYPNTEIIDFLTIQKEDIKNDFSRDIITNPPYKYAMEFVEHALDISMDSTKVIMFLKIQFLEGQKRAELFDKYPPKYVYVNSKRQTCYINGDMSKKMSSATCYCWFVWEKGFKGSPIIKWI